MEKRIEDWQIDMAQRGYPVSRRLVFLSVKRYLDKKKIASTFKDNVPGVKWWKLFLARHPQLKEKKAEKY